MKGTHKTQMPNYSRTYEELEQVASKFWPEELSEMEAKISVVPLLLRTQDQFISILNIETTNIDNFYDIIEASALPGNLFLKHLVILSDFGGEMLKRVSNEAETMFPERRLNYIWQGNARTYQFRSFPDRKFSNTNLKIDGKKLFNKHPLDDLQKDAIALLLFGSGYLNNGALSKCEIGEYLGKPDNLNTFIKQRYIWVSRITGGAKSNSLGQLAQDFVAKYINEHLKMETFSIRRSGRLPNVTHTDSHTNRETSFDLVIESAKRYVAVEVSFQVTTNSVIERKAGQAKGRFEQVEAAGHKIAYVIDGAGNFERETALRTICSYSHCTVAFSRDELDNLCEFITHFLQG